MATITQQHAVRAMRPLQASRLVLEGEVECKNAAIAGETKGILKVLQTLRLSPTANVQGKVYTEKLSVEPGATINGSVSMGAVMKKVGEADSENTRTA